VGVGGGGRKRMGRVVERVMREMGGRSEYRFSWKAFVSEDTARYGSVR
jgi:hypothetical protein